jgi:O-antigen/teichoic acid export membrane protein
MSPPGGALGRETGSPAPSGPAEASVAARSWVRGASGRLSARAEVSASLLDQAIVSASNFLLAALLARALGIRGYGVFVLALTAVTFVASLQQAWIVAPFVTLWNTRDPAQRGRYESLVLLMQGAFALVSAALIAGGTHAWVAADQRWTEIARVSWPLAGYAAAFLLQDFIRRFFFTRGEPLTAASVDAIAYVGQLGAVAGLAASGALSVETAFAGAGGAFLLAAVYGALRTRATLRGASVRDLASTAAEHWRHSAWMVGSSLLQWSSGNYFLIAAGAVLGAAVPGVIRAAQNIMGLTHVLFLALENVLPGRMARALRNGGKPELRRLFGRSLVAVGGFTLAVSLAVALAAAQLLTLVYGASLRGHGFVLWWFAAIYPLIAITTVQRFALRAALVSRPFFASYAVTSVLSLALAFPLVRGLGLSGAMLGLLLTQAVSCAYLGIHVRKVLR